MNPELIRDELGWALEESHRHEPEFPLWFGPLEYWRAWSWTDRVIFLAAVALVVIVAITLVIGLLALGPQPQTGGPK